MSIVDQDKQIAITISLVDRLYGSLIWSSVARCKKNNSSIINSSEKYFASQVSECETKE